MTKKQIKAFYNKCINNVPLTEEDYDFMRDVLELACKKYYNDGLDILENYQYDYLYEKYNVESGSTFTYGANPSKKSVSVKHPYPDLVGTLHKVNSIEEFIEWITKRVPKNYKKTIRIRISDKYDGNSTVLVIRKGKVVQAITRGKNGKGADVTPYLKHIYVSKKIPDCGIKVEVMIYNRHFNILNKKLKKNPEEYYANPRSLVTGMLSNLKLGDEFSKYLSLAPLKVQLDEEEDYKFDKLLKRLEGKNSSDAFMKFNYEDVECGSIEEVVDAVERVYIEKIKHRENEDREYDIDGIVIDILNEDIRETLGRKNHGAQFSDDFAVALKFPYLSKESRLKRVEWDCGKTGVYTPCAVYKKVVFNGAGCTRTSLSNLDRFKKLKLHKGDKLLIEYRNETLAYVQKLEDSKDNNKRIPIKKTCDYCMQDLVQDGAFLKCVNDECQCRAEGKILNWLKNLEIKGTDEMTINKLHVEGLLNTIYDLYTLTPEDIMTLEGFKEKSANNIINSIHSRKEIYDWELIGSLLIRGFSLKNAKALLKSIPLDELLMYTNRNQFVKRVVDIYGFDTISANYIYDGLKNNKNLIKKLRKVLTIKTTKIVKGDTKSIKVVITGSIMFNPKFTNRKQLTEYLEERGIEVIGSVSKNTNYLITDDVSNSTKMVKALSLGIPIIKTNELDKIL